MGRVLNTFPYFLNNMPKRKNRLYRNIEKAVIPYDNLIVRGIFSQQNDMVLPADRPMYVRRHDSELHDFDYGMEGYKCGLVMKKRKELDKAYDLHSHLKYTKHVQNRESLLKSVNDYIVSLETELGI